MSSTQDNLPIVDIHDDLVALKDGSIAMVLQAGAVNFDLLSEREQLAIIDGFAGFLNSLSFAVQIVIRSRRLDITNYLETLQKAQAQQKNPLLSTMMGHYRAFISTTIKENEVLDKQFYVVILASYLELGILKNKEQNFKKAVTILIPRRDHIIRQFSRVGLKVSQLNNERLIKLMYDIYNEPPETEILPVQTTAQVQAAAQPTPTAMPNPTITPPSPNLPIQPPPPVQPAQQASGSSVAATYRTRPSNSTPYVVEELPDDYGTV